MSKTWKHVEKLAAQMEAFEAKPSQKNTGTGSRREGAGFERLLGELWEAVRQTAVAEGAACSFVAGAGRRRWAKLTQAGRSQYLPNNPQAPLTKPDDQPSRWLEVDFDVTELVSAYPGLPEVVARYAPPSGPFAGDNYPEMFAALQTRFDDTIILENDGVLKEKLLLEYKTGKSSKGVRMDANVHERLSFQIMQYLEVATRYPACSLVVFTNGAYSRYRNKYHVNFRVQADRLRCFKWFDMHDASTAPEYLSVIRGLLGWLRDGTDRRVVGSRA